MPTLHQLEFTFEPIRFVLCGTIEGKCLLQGCGQRVQILIAAYLFDQLPELRARTVLQVGHNQLQRFTTIVAIVIGTLGWHSTSSRVGVFIVTALGLVHCRTGGADRCSAIALVAETKRGQCMVTAYLQGRCSTYFGFALWRLVSIEVSERSVRVEQRTFLQGIHAVDTHLRLAGLLCVDAVSTDRE